MVNDVEGTRYAEPMLKVTGIDIVRSSTPLFCRDKLKKAVQLLVAEDMDGLRTYVEEVRVLFEQSPPEVIAKPSGVNGLEKYHDHGTIYKKGCPIHVRGALLHNALVKQAGLTSKYRPLEDEDKIKFVYLQLPNPLFENIISFMDKLPDEFGLGKYVDYKLQFEKVFMSALNIMMEASGVSLKKVNTFKGLL